ncbi:MAG: hypothetical protein ACRED2_05920 [Methylocella sp.]
MAELEERKTKAKEDKRDDLVKMVDELVDELALVGNPFAEQGIDKQKILPARDLLRADPRRMES